ncbi:MAG: NAD-dependent epimerase/dehydratase family protein [Sphingobacteriales bacterium]|nr:NAD-dependent epimerase/dehydratase family protein [Sphingobacteriales bacterium]
MKKYVLISGGAGFIGSSLAERLLQNPDFYVVIADNLLTGRKENLPPPSADNWEFAYCDINNYTELSALMERFSFHTVFHYAAVVGVQRTLQHPLWVMEDVKGIKNICELAAACQVQRFVYASSSEVYGISEHFPQHEEHTPLNARLPYAIVKNVGEAFCHAYFQEKGLNYNIFRFFNTYGNKQNPDFVVSKFIRAALRNEPLTVYGDGSQQRTFCFIADNLDATLYATEHAHTANQTFNIGNDAEVSVLELAKLIIDISGSSSEIIHLPALKEGDMPRRQPDVTRMKTLLQRPFTPLREGLQQVIEHYAYR